MSSAPPLLTVLRQATRPAHDRLETLTLSDRIMDGSLRPAEYERIIEWQRRVHEKLEPLVRGFTGGAYEYRERYPVLVDTSEEPYGTPPMSNQHGAPPVSNQNGKPTTLGTLYVLEGASLGGTVIYRKLQANPVLVAYAPFPFYRDQADWGLQQWRAYLAYVKTLELSPEQIQQATDSAVATFALFESLWQ